MMGLPEGENSFKIGFAILIQYRRVTDTQPATKTALAYTCIHCAGKKVQFQIIVSKTLRTKMTTILCLL